MRLTNCGGASGARGALAERDQHQRRDVLHAPAIKEAPQPPGLSPCLWDNANSTASLNLLSLPSSFYEAPRSSTFAFYNPVLISQPPILPTFALSFIKNTRLHTRRRASTEQTTGASFEPYRALHVENKGKARHDRTGKEKSFGEGRHTDE